VATKQRFGRISCQHRQFAEIADKRKQQSPDECKNEHSRSLYQRLRNGKQGIFAFDYTIAPISGSGLSLMDLLIVRHAVWDILDQQGYLLR
jgi:hypothetical protein